MYNLQKDVLIGTICLAALFGFISGQFVISTVLFGMATVLSNISSAQPTAVKIR